MTGHWIRLVGARCAFAFLLLGVSTTPAEAAFTVTINGTSVTDNGAGDTDPTAGFIVWTTNIDGYAIRLTSSTDSSHPTADLTTSQLRIVNSGGSSTPLLVTISESFDVPPGFRGDQTLMNTLTRNIIAGLATSGSVSSTTSAASESGGGAGSTDPTTLTSAVDSGVSFGSFLRTSELYLFSQIIRIDGLLGNNGVTITASSFSPSQGGLNIVPTPPAIGLLAVGLFTLGVCRRIRAHPGKEPRL